MRLRSAPLRAEAMVVSRRAEARARGGRRTRLQPDGTGRGQLVIVSEPPGSCRMGHWALRR